MCRQRCSPSCALFLIRSDLLLALCRSSLHWYLFSDLHYFSHFLIQSSQYYYCFYLGTGLLSIPDVLAPLRSAAFFLHLPSLRSAPICSFPSDLSAPIFLPRLYPDQLWFLWSCSVLLVPIGLDQLDRVCSVFRYSGPSNLSWNSSPLHSSSPSPSMHYNIEYISHINI